MIFRRSGLPWIAPVVPGQLDRRVVRLRAAALEQHPRHAPGGAQRQQPLGQLHRRARAPWRRTCGSTAASASADAPHPPAAAREKPRLAHQSPAIASIYSRPSVSHTRQPSPRSIRIAPSRACAVEVGLLVHQAGDVAGVERVRVHVGLRWDRQCSAIPASDGKSWPAAPLPPGPCRRF